jgi:hypothetical protein
VRLKRTYWILALLTLLALCAAGAYSIFYGWPVVRNAGYKAMVAEFSRAFPREPMRRGSNEPPVWDFDLSLTGGVIVKVTARGFMDTPTLKYSDERKARVLYRYVDYSSPIAVRTSGTMLYVYWGETLFHTDYRLLAFDLARRREVSRRKVDGRDMPPIAAQ